MSAEFLYEDEIIKSLHKLEGILEKSQITTGSGNEPKKWAGGDKEDYDSDTDAKWDDDIDENGTDYKGKKVKKGMDADCADDEKEDYDKDMDKSVRQGVEVSEFLSELTKSIALYIADIEDTLNKSIDEIYEEHGRILKALSDNLVVLNDTVSKSQTNVTRFANEPARGPKSVLNMSKSVDAGNSADPTKMEKGQVLMLLEKAVIDGKISPLEVTKCELSGVGAVNPTILKSLMAS